jgi:hypothetical protein
MHLKKVTGKPKMIQEQKFLISFVAAHDPNRPLYITELRKLNQELARAIDELAFAEEQIIDDELAEASNVDYVDLLIDATIASVLDKRQQQLTETHVLSMTPYQAPDDGNEDGEVDVESFAL